MYKAENGVDLVLILRLRQNQVPGLTGTVYRA